MKRNLLLLCLLCLIATNRLSAQTQTDTDRYSLYGQIKDTDGSPVELANIALLSAADSTYLQGTCSRADGTFTLPGTPPGRYLLQVSCIGYETQLLSSDGITAVVCILPPASYTLQEAGVTARRPSYRLKEGGTLETDVRHSLLARFDHAADVLARLPGVRGSADGSFTVFGKGTPLIYIDNRKVQNTEELQRLAAADIDKVELITQPGPEYDAEVKAVIRIRTVRKQTDGWGGYLRFAFQQRRRPGHMEQAGVHYQHGGLSIQASAYSNRYQERRSQDTRYLIAPVGNDWQTLHDVRNTSDFQIRGRLEGMQTSVDYTLNERHSLGASYQYSRTPNFRMQTHSRYGTQSANGNLNENTVQTSENRQQDNAHQLNAYYQGNAGKWHIDLTADVLAGSKHDNQQAHETSDNDTERDINSYNRSRNRLYAIKLILSHPLGAGTLKAGSEYNFIRRRDRFINLQDLLPSTDSRIDEQKAAAFAQYALSLGKINVTAGLRYEHARSRYYEQEVFIPEQSRTYNDWLPTLSVDFPMGTAQASLSYTAKTRRPSFSNLRTSVNYNNRYVYEGGNPLLQPETRHDLQLMLLWKWIQGSISYQRRTNAISFQSRDYSDDPEVVLFSSANYPRIEKLSASLFFSPKTGCWEPTIGAFFTQPFLTIQNGGETRRMNHASVYAVWRNNWVLPHGWMVSLDADIQSRGDQGTARNDRMWGMDVSVRRSWLDGRLSVALQGSDLWNSRRMNIQLFGSRLTYSKVLRPDSRCFLLTVSYRFRLAGKAYRGKHAAEEDLQRL